MQKAAVNSMYEGHRVEAVPDEMKLVRAPNGGWAIQGAIEDYRCSPKLIACYSNADDLLEALKVMLWADLEGRA